MKVVVNGVPRDVADGATVAEVVAVITQAGSGVAVAVNDEVVPRGSWPQTVLGDADRVEILNAVQGG
jgi:sulfur carrier protein